MRDVVPVRWAERQARGTAAACGRSTAARGPVPLDQAALGHGERDRRPAVIMPVGVLAAFPGQPTRRRSWTSARAGTAHIGVPDRKISHRPQHAARPAMTARS